MTPKQRAEEIVGESCHLEMLGRSEASERAEALVAAITVALERAYVEGAEDAESQAAIALLARNNPVRMV